MFSIQQQQKILDIERSRKNVSHNEQKYQSIEAASKLAEMMELEDIHYIHAELFKVRQKHNEERNGKYLKNQTKLP